MISTLVLAVALSVGAEGDLPAEGGQSSQQASPQSSQSSGGGFLGWFMAHDRIYENTGFMGLSWTYGRFNGGALEAKGLGDKSSEGVVPSSSTWTQGIGFELGKASNAFGLGKHVGLLAFGLNGFWTDDQWGLVYGQEVARVQLYGGTVRAFHPRARFVLGRFDLSAQVGPAVHVGVASGKGTHSPPQGVPGAPSNGAEDLLDTSAFAGLGLEGQASLRFYPLEMFYLEGAYRHSFQIVNFVGAIDGMHDWHMGIGLSY